MTCHSAVVRDNFVPDLWADTGAGEKYQLFGQVGLDHGPEWYHGKWTGISTTFSKPTYSRSVYVAGGTIETTATSS